MFFYGHPRNRFWKVLSMIFNCEVPCDIEGRKEFLLSHKIALCDVIHSCEITGSSDNSVKNVVPNDISHILTCADIQKVFVNGKCAYKYYKKYIYPETDVDCVLLPSTSPANAGYTADELFSHWKEILDYCSD